MASPYLHFLNFHNSCAIDAFLELIEFTVFPELHHVNLGDFLTRIYDVCRERHVRGATITEGYMSALRERPWAWFEERRQSFEGRSMESAFEEILDYMSQTDEEVSMFVTKLHTTYNCMTCQEDRFITRALFPIYISDDETLQNAQYDLSSTVENLHGKQTARRKTCQTCRQPMVASQMQTILPKFLFVCLPTTLGEGDRLHVIEGVKVKENLLVDEKNSFSLVGAVRNTGNHFTVVVKHEDMFFHIDDQFNNVRLHKNFKDILQNSPNGDYSTTAADGFFIFVYKNDGHGNNSLKCIFNDSLTESSSSHSRLNGTKNSETTKSPPTAATKHLHLITKSKEENNEKKVSQDSVISNHTRRLVSSPNPLFQKAGPIPLSSVPPPSEPSIVKRLPLQVVNQDEKALISKKSDKDTLTGTATIPKETNALQDISNTLSEKKIHQLCHFDYTKSSPLVNHFDDIPFINANYYGHASGRKATH